MNHTELVVFLVQISVMLAVALTFGRLAQRFHLPAVIGELVGGVLLGPTLLGVVAPNLFASLFPPEGSVVVASDAVIKLGLLCFLFVAGLEVQLGLLRRLAASIAGASILGIAVPFALGLSVVLFFPGLWGDTVLKHGPLFALFIGTALSISALPVIARILMDLSLTRTRLGTVVLAAATIDDMIGWSLFAVILSKFTAPGEASRTLSSTLLLVVLLFGFILTVGRWAGRRLMQAWEKHPGSTSRFIGVSAIAVLLTAATAEMLGIHALLGAFLVGMALSQKSDKRHIAHEMVHQFSMSFFAPIYFVSIGLQANFAASFDPILVSVLLVVACVGKIGGVGLGARLGRMTVRESLAVGFGMNARGAMGMILASVALEQGLIDHRIFVALIVMAVVTSLMSGPLMQRLSPKAVSAQRAGVGRPVVGLEREPMPLFDGTAER